MPDINGFLLTYFVSIIAVVTLDLFIGTTLLQFYIGLIKTQIDEKENLSMAATNWGLLNWLLSIFLILNGFNLIVIYLLSNLFLRLLLSFLCKGGIIFLGLLPYFLKKRYKNLSLNPVHIFKGCCKKENFVSFTYFSCLTIILFVTLFKLPCASFCFMNDIHSSVIHIIWPSLFLIFIQIINLARFKVWQVILSA